MNPAVQLFVGGFTRFVQGFCAAAPTLLVGLFIAAILRYYVGRNGTRRLFGGDSIRQLPQSWLIGMLLPVCSIGVLPILREMRRAGIKPGAMSAFALSAPLFNPLSLLYGLTLSRPLVIILFAAGSLLIVTVLGLVWDAIDRRSKLTSASPSVPDELHVIGLRRLAAMLMQLGRETTGLTMLSVALALFGLFALAAVLPFGSMQTSVEQSDPWAPLTMTGVAVPAYATPMLAMSQLGMMFQHGNSPGAAFALLILGTGLNLATIVWFGSQFGWKPTLIWGTSLLTIVLSLSYVMNQPLIPPGIQPAGHTHAFDIYSNPLSDYHDNAWRTFWETVENNSGLAETLSIVGIALLGTFGLLLRILGLDESKLSASPAAGGLDRVVPRSVMGTTMLSGLVAFSVVACFAYYPSTEECLAEISIARAECLSASMSGNTEHALFWLPVWEDWSRKLEVGTFLRRGTLRRYQQMQGYLIRKKLELLEHELEHDEVHQDEVLDIVHEILATNRRWVASFKPSN
ncbi:permease [Rhodopirellula sp. MGV]|uniref:permease n=1 Tax=Rhodopirellula sp. MGV TaxID=2023130 RepID=UPI000B967192|nr:permease [Rhodopirellula sp. MGV]OYP38816.1 permease [Rhodopirellula sp. MGV]